MKKEHEKLVTRKDYIDENELKDIPEKELYSLSNARLIFLSIMELIDDITELDQNIEYLIDEGIDIEKIKNAINGSKYLTFRDPE